MAARKEREREREKKKERERRGQVPNILFKGTLPVT
jgi:hypothetical protein